jgi:DNA-binding response OmpR family regulator
VGEEDDLERETLATELRADGYRVIAVEDGMELFDYLELATLSKGRIPAPDLIVSDVELAGYDGVQICRMLSRAEDSVPFILLAPRDDPNTWENAEEAGAAHVLDKPVDVEDLHDVIACYLGDT